MADDFYPFVDSGDPAPDNSHITGAVTGDKLCEANNPAKTSEDHTGAYESDTVAAARYPASPLKKSADENPLDTSRRPFYPNDPENPDYDADDGTQRMPESTIFATRIAIYDDMLSTPRVIVVQPNDPRSYLEEITNTVYRCMKEQGGSLSLMVIRELVENFIHAHFTEPIVSILDNGNTIRFADQGPGIEDKERAFEFGVTSADRSMKRYIRGTGAGLPMVQQYLENAGGAISIEDNLNAGTVVTVSVDAARVGEIESHCARGAAVRGASFTSEQHAMGMRGSGAGEAAVRSAAAVFTAGGQPPYGMQYPAYPAASMHGTPATPITSAGNPNAYAGTPQQPSSSPADNPSQYLHQVPGNSYLGQPGYSAQQAGFTTQLTTYAAQQPPYTEAQTPHTSQQTPYVAQYMPQTYPAVPGWQQAQPYAPYGYPSAAPGSGMYPAAAQPAQPSYQQSEQKFSTNQQPRDLPAEIPSSFAPIQGTPPVQHTEPYVSERGILALNFIAQHGQCGPTELAGAFGHSNPTWSRELATLSEHGFTTKHGRKYFLTSLGRDWLTVHNAHEQEP